MYKMPIKKLNFSSSPLNDNPASFANARFNNGFSHLNGQPTIKFSIPAQDLLLDTSSLFLTGQIIHQAPDRTPIVGTIGQRIANYDLNNGAQLRVNTQVNYNQWNGISSVIDKVVIQSKKTTQELASIINYSQYDALKQGYSYNEDEYKQMPLMRNLCSGANHNFTNRHTVSSPDLTDTTFGAEAQNSKFYGQFFSVPIDVALLKNQPLHLGNNYTGGLMLTIHLNNDSSVYFSRHRRGLVAGQATFDIGGTHYVLKNVKLEGKYLQPTPQDLASYQSNILLNARQNLVNDIVSSENSSVYTPQLQMVKGIVNVYQDDDQNNSFSQNQYNFRRPLGLVEYQQAKNGVRYPQDFVVKMLPNIESITENNTVGQGTFTARATRTNLDGLMKGQEGTIVADAELRLNFMKSLMGRKVGHHSANLDLSKFSYQNDYDAEEEPGQNNIGAGTATGSNMNGDLVGVGADFSNGISMVQNFVNQDYELRVKSGVNSSQGMLPTTRNTRIEIQESFIRNFEQMNLQSLVKSM